jgi:ATP-dependent DNA helicase DinG
LQQCATRATELADALEQIAAAQPADGARLLESHNKGFSLHLLPFDVGPRFRALVDAGRCAWIFTSATLSMGGNFKHFASRLGLGEAAATLRIESPFDYARQALLYLPGGMPDPSSPDYTRAVVTQALTLIDASGGGAFLLFTSHRALERAAQLLREHWAGAIAPTLRYRLLVQGESPRELLLREFRSDPHSVLLGTSSFWEGVDVKGQALRLVVIDATWRKSLRMLLEHPSLAALPRLSLHAPAPSCYGSIRTARQADQISTLEATVQALAMLEGPSFDPAPLLDAFGRFVAGVALRISTPPARPDTA